MAGGKGRVEEFHVRRGMVGHYVVVSSLAAVVGVVSGLAALVFRYAIWALLNLLHAPGALLADPVGILAGPATNPDLFNLDAGAFYPLLGSARFLLVLIIPLGGLLTGLIIAYLAPEAKGAGTPQAMEAVSVHEGRMRARVVPLKTLASAITIASGGSAGREGPIVQIGAGAGSSIAQLFRLSNAPRKILLACGAAGAIAATFSAPIAGVLFGVELILVEFRTRSFIPLVISSVFAVATAGLFLPTGPQLPAEYTFTSVYELGLFVVLGLLTGLASVLWVRIRYGIQDLISLIHLHPALKPALGAALLVPIALLLPEIMGVGYSTLNGTVNGSFLQGNTVTLILLLGALALFKMVATGLSLGSGGSGGEFAPSLFIGAMVGGAFGLAVHTLLPGSTNPVGAFALVGMGALFAGASRATLTSIVIVFELTGDYKFILPVMLACVISDAVAAVLHRETIYTEELTRKGITFHHDMELNILRTVAVHEAMVTDVETVGEDVQVEEVARRMVSTGHQGFPVLNAAGEMVGIVTHSDVRRALEEGKGDHPVSEVETQALVVGHPQESLEDALAKMAIAEIGHLPIVLEADPKRLVGYLSRGDVVRAYQRKAMEERHAIYGGGRPR